MRNQSRFLKGTIYMIVSGFALSVMVLLSRFLLEDLPIYALLFLRFFIPALLLFPLILFTEKEAFSEIFSFKRENLWKSFRSLLVVGAQFFILYYLTKGTVLNATVLLNTGPLFIPILERVFLKLKIGKSTAVAMLVSALGVILILHPDASLFKTTSLIGLSAGICQAGSQVLFGHYAHEEKGIYSIFRLFFISTLIVFPFFIGFSVGHFKDLFSHISSIVWIILIAVSIFSIVNQLFRSKAYFFGKPSTLACFLYVSIVFSALFDWLFFKKEPDLLTYIGASLVILGGILKIYLRYLILKRKGL